MKQTTLVPEYVEFIPERLVDGVLYISETYKTALHRCACGCGEEVVTPLSPAEWRLQRVGDTVSLSPSIGNWSFSCKSHYIVRRNRVVWAESMTDAQIAQVKVRDARDKARHLSYVNSIKHGLANAGQSAQSQKPAPGGGFGLKNIWRNVMARLRKWSVHV